MTDARLSLRLIIFFILFFGEGGVVILGIAQGIREMPRCHHPTLLSITSVIVPSSAHCDGSRDGENVFSEEGFYVQSKNHLVYLQSGVWQLFSEEVS